jgi:predicted PurR-regulated permease PerM
LVIPAIVNAFAQSLEDYVLTPLIQGQVTHLHPIAIMLAIIAGGSLAGLYGMILAVPIAACTKVMLSEVVGPRLRQWATDAVGPATLTIPKTSTATDS